MSEQDVMRDTSTMRLGQRLRRARLARNLTQGEVAKNQFSVSYVSAVERGQIRPSLGALEKLAERLQVPLTDLLSGQEQDFKPISTGAAARESATRYREDIDDRLREAQILSRQGKVEEALTILLRLSNQTLSTREETTLHWHLAYCYIEQGRGEEARREAAEGLRLAERLDNVDLTERLRNELGNAYSLLHSHAIALDTYRACLPAIERGLMRDTTFQLSVYFNIGNQYWNLGEYDNAIEYLRKGADLAADVVNPEVLGGTYWALSLAYSNQGDHSQAKLYAMRAIACYEQADNRRLVARIYNRLGRTYALSGQIQDALTQLETAYEIARSQQDARGMAEAQRSLAEVYLEEGRLAEAVSTAEEALASGDATDDPLQRAESLLTLAKVQERQENYRAAEQSYDQAIELLQPLEALEHLRDAYAQFSEFLERRGESQRAYEMLKQAYRSSGRGVANI